MKVYIKLLVFLSALLCLFGMLAFALVRFAEADVLRVQHELKQREGIVIDNIIQLKRSNMRVFAWDYSWWQDLIDWIEEPNPEWLKDQFEQVLYTYDVGFFAVYDASGQRLSSVYDPDLAVARVELPDQLSPQVLGREQALLYEATFDVRPEGLLEMYYAPIMPQEDTARSGRHYGYLVVGRYWDASYIEGLESITGAKMTLQSEPSVAPSSGQENGWQGSIQLERQLFDHFGKLQSILVIEKFLPVSKRILDQQYSALVWLIVATVITVLSLVLFVLCVVTRPLRNLSDAMETGNVEELSDYGNGRSEFKRLAELIAKNYEQQERLEAEVRRRRNTEDELTRSRDSAQCASRAKSQFLANVSHETRTPLHTISGYAALLEESSLDEEQMQSLALIRSSTDRLVQMLSGIIELSNMEAEQMRPHQSWFYLSDLFDELASAGENACGQCPVSFSSEFVGTFPNRVYLDYDRLRMLLLNLLDNATKFTSSGSVTVRCRSVKKSACYDLLWEVEDTGIGIPKDELVNIFEPFYLVDESDSRRHQGVGLGLAIARGLSDILDAELKVESVVGEGAVFSLKITLTEQEVSFEREQVDHGETS